MEKEQLGFLFDPTATPARNDSGRPRPAEPCDASGPRAHPPSAPPFDAGLLLREDAGPFLREDAGPFLREDAGPFLREDAGPFLREDVGGTSVRPALSRGGGRSYIELKLREVLGPRVLVALTSNRSTMISYRRRSGVLYVRLHGIFARAPEEVLWAVGHFIREGATTERDTKLIDDWIELHRRDVRRPPDRPLLVQPAGEVHDLAGIFDRLNAGYFRGAIRAQITWSRAAKKQKRTSIRMGSYCEEQELIRIHPALDQTFVPVYFVESVVFHEMLHEWHGVTETPDGRRCVHSSEFQADERRYPLFDDARRWERKNLSKLLRY